MKAEVGVWEEAYQNQTQHWLRWRDMQGDLLFGGERAIAAEAKAARLAERLRELGVDPDLIECHPVKQFILSAKQWLRSHEPHKGLTVFAEIAPVLL